jgi:hypothetical protein
MKKLALLVLTGLYFQASAFAACIPFNDPSQPILTAGEYCLTKDLIVDRNGVQIYADNVIFDLGGFAIGNSKVPYQSQGIWGQGKNITVRNGAVIGFDNGVAIFNWNTDGVTTIENMIISGKRINPEKTSLNGIIALGPNVSIKNNVVAGLTGAYVHAIDAWGADSVNGGIFTISNNRIMQIRSIVSAKDPLYSNARALASATAISVRWARQSNIQNNMILDVVPGPGGTAIGIDYESLNTDNGNSTIFRNQISNVSSVDGSVGIFAVAKQSTAIPLRILGNDINMFTTGIYVHDQGANQQPVVSSNVVRNATTPYVGGQQLNNK